MKLKIGIDRLTPGWQTIFWQQGYCFGEFGENDNRQFSDFTCLIINNKPDPELSGKITNYLNAGGVVLAHSEAARSILQISGKKKTVKFLIPGENSVFSDLDIIDFYQEFHFFPGKGQWLDKNLMIQKFAIGSGFMLTIPFHPDRTITNFDPHRKKFPAKRLELPSEIVAKISKHKIRKLIHKLILIAHQKRNLPLVRISEFPREMKSLFMFRVDTDFCTPSQAKDLYELCRKHKIRGTWFVDTRKPQMLKQVYGKMKDQEIGLHCSRHLVFNDYERNKANLEIGLAELNKAGLTVKGFAAPFGDWNENLARSLEEKKFNYSSEFVLDYENLPFYPFYSGRFSKVLQIPIHPISTGRLRRSHFSLAEMWNYFKLYIDYCLARREAIILYHHPSHGHLEVWDKIFSYINHKKVPHLTFTEYAEFWKSRLNYSFEVEYTTNNLILQSPRPAGQIQFTIETPEKCALVNYQKEISLADLVWEIKEAGHSPGDVRKLRKWHWRDTLYNYESRKGKKYHENLSG